MSSQGYLCNDVASEQTYWPAGRECRTAALLLDIDDYDA